MFSAPDSVCIDILGFPVYYYGIILALAIFCGVVISNRIAIKKYFMCGIVPNIATSTIIGGVIGARLYYCALNYSFYLKNPIEILMLREGGLSIHGAILGGAAVLLYQAKRQNVEFLKLCDIFALGLPLAQSIGRWGNFFNSEAFGLPTDLPWKMFVKETYRPDKYLSYSYFHPAFLYESLLDILIFLILYYLIMPENKENSGIITAWYLILYSIVRIFIENMRIDCVKYICGIPFPQFISVILLAVAISFLVFKKIKRE